MEPDVSGCLEWYNVPRRVLGSCQKKDCSGVVYFAQYTWIDCKKQTGENSGVQSAGYLRWMQDIPTIAETKFHQMM